MEEKYKNSLATTASILAIAGTIALLVLAYAQIDRAVKNVSDRTANFSAQGRATVQPDTADVSFSVVTQAQSAKQAQDDNNTKTQQAVNFLKENGIPDDKIKTTNYSLYPQYDYDPCSRNLPQSSSAPASRADLLEEGAPDAEPAQPATPDCSPRIVSYEARQSILFSTNDFALASNIVGRLADQGVNQINNVRFYIDDPETARAQARQDALDRLEAKAQGFAAEAGVTLGRIISISESSGFEPIFAERSFDGYGGGAAAPLEPGMEEINVNVSITYEIR